MSEHFFIVASVGAEAEMVTKKRKVARVTHRSILKTLALQKSKLNKSTSHRPILQEQGGAKVKVTASSVFLF